MRQRLHQSDIARLSVMAYIDASEPDIGRYTEGLATSIRLNLALVDSNPV